MSDGRMLCTLPGCLAVNWERTMSSAYMQCEWCAPSSRIRPRFFEAAASSLWQENPVRTVTLVGHYSQSLRPRPVHSCYRRASDANGAGGSMMSSLKAPRKLSERCALGVGESVKVAGKESGAPWFFSWADRCGFIWPSIMVGGKLKPES